MKTTIVKNNDFKTIGIEVTQNNKTVLNWGVAPLIQFHFVKEVSMNDYGVKIIELIKINERLSLLGFEFTKMFFESVFKKEGQEVSLNSEFVKKEEERLWQKFDNILQNIR
jgi:hypothetical protein